MEKNLKIFEAMDTYLPDVDGVINCVNNYSLNLKDKVDLTVMVPKNRKDYVENLPYKVIRCKSIHIPILNAYYGLPKNDRKFEKQIMDSDIDLIHVHSPFNMAKFAIKVAKKKNIPVVATFHSNMRTIFQDVTKSKLITKLLVNSLGKTYNKFDEVFCCSPLVADQVRSYGYKGKITLLPFGTDFKKCENVDELSALADKKFGLEKNQLVFVYVGRIMKLKRIDFILKSLKIAKDKGLNFKFYAVGKGPELKKLKKLSKKLAFSEEEVIFTGFLPREDFPLILARADLLLFPSIYDNFGLVKLESASYETPGLFIKDSCAGDGIRDGIDGFLANDDINDFADKILEATKDADHLKQVGINAKQSLHITWSECTDVLLENYKRIIKEYKDGGNKNDN